MTTDPVRPWRSVLYVPGSNDRAIAKMTSLEADAFILDLEDSVAPGEKVRARGNVARVLEGARPDGRTRIVRINGLDTDWGRADLDAIAGAGAEAILLPKVERVEQVTALSDLLDAGPCTAATRIWAMMESAGAQFGAAEVAKAPRMAGLVIGTNDLAAELGCEDGGDRMPMMTALQTCLAAARAAGIVCLDGVYNGFRDADGLLTECRQGKRLGMDGKTVIHPAQIPVANDVFTPGAAEIAAARRTIDAWGAAEREGRGVAVLDGRIVEALHVRAARLILARADAAGKATTV